MRGRRDDDAYAYELCPVWAPEQYLKFLNLLISQIENAPHDLQKQLIRSIIHKIIVHPDQIEVLMHVGKYVLGDSSDGNKHKLKQSSHTLTNDGAERDRTVDLLNAIQALSQLSYSPNGLRNIVWKNNISSREWVKNT